MDSLMGANLKLLRLKGEVAADMVIERLWGADLMGWAARVDTGEPWKEDLLSKNWVLEREEVRVVAMAAIEELREVV